VGRSLERAGRSGTLGGPQGLETSPGSRLGAVRAIGAIHDRRYLRRDRNRNVAGFTSQPHEGVDLIVGSPTIGNPDARKRERH
jgi:hypothetical protein